MSKFVFVVELTLGLLVSVGACFLISNALDFSSAEIEEKLTDHLDKMTISHAKQLASRLGRTKSVVRAMASFAETVWKDAGYAFSLDPEHSACMDKEEVTPKLQAEFKKRGHELSLTANVSVQKQSRKWLIEDTHNNRQYSVTRVGENLQVYLSTIPHIPSYYHNKAAPPGLLPPDIYNDPKYKRPISTKVSCFQIAPHAFHPDYRKIYASSEEETENPLYKVDRPVLDAILNTSKMDIIWRYLYSAYPEHAWLYMGYELGFHRSFPWHKYPDKSYDPRVRPWYVGARSAGSDVFWSCPYLDASGLGMIITASRCVTVDRKFVGVVAADLALVDLVRYLQDFKPSSQGYNFIFDETGTAVIHPTFLGKQPGNWPRTSIDELEKHGKDFADLKEKALRGMPAAGIVECPEHKAIFAMAPIPGTPLFLGSAAPLTDLLQSQSPTFSRSRSHWLQPWGLGAGAGFFLVAGLLLFFRVRQSDHWKFLAFLLPAAGVVSGNLLGVFFLESPRYQTEKDILKQTVAHAATLDEFFYRIESITRTIGGFARETWERQLPSRRPSFFHDPGVVSLPEHLQYSERHQCEVAFGHSSFKVAPSAYSNPREYEKLSESETYGRWPQEVQRAIDMSAGLDLIFIPMYASMNEIMWTYIGLKEGILRSYPYNGPISRSYDPRLRPWYLAALDSDPEQVIFTTPFIDVATGKVIITSTLKVQDSQGDLIGAVGIDVQLETIQNAVLAIETGHTGHSFLLNRNFYIMAHPSHTLPKKSWSETDLQVSVEQYETSNAKFSALLNHAAKGYALQKTIDYGDERGEQLVSLAPLQRSGMILGLVIPHSEMSPSGLSGRNRLMIVLAALDLILLAGLVIAFKK